MDLRVARIGHQRAALVGAPARGHVAALGVSREVEDVAIAAGREDHGVGGVRGDRAGDHVAHHDALGVPIDHHDVEHLRAREHLDRLLGDLAAERGVGAEQELLPGLAASVKGARNLRTAEAAIGEQAAVFAGERDALRDALVDDRRTDFREPIDVGLPRAEVAALDRVVKETLHGVTVVLIVLRRVDPALRGDGVRAARRVLVAKALHLVTHLPERRRGARPGEAGADDDDLVLPPVRGIDQLGLELVLLPFRLQRPGRNSGIEHGAGGCHCG